MNSTPISQLSLAQLRETLAARDRQLAACEGERKLADTEWVEVLREHRYLMPSELDLLCLCGLGIEGWSVGVTWHEQWLKHIVGVVAVLRTQSEEQGDGSAYPL